MLQLANTAQVPNVTNTTTPSLSSSFFHIGEKLHEFCVSLKARLSGRFVTREVAPLSKNNKDILAVALYVLIPMTDKGVKRSFLIDDDSLSIQLPVAPKTLVKNGKEVRNIQFWFNPNGYFPGAKKDDNTPKSRFLLTYHDQTSEGFAIPEMKTAEQGAVFVGALFGAFIEAGADVETAFLNHKKRLVQNWMTPIQPAASMRTYYSKAIPKMASLLAATIVENSLYQEKATRCGLQLFLYGSEEKKSLKAIFQDTLSLEPEIMCISNNAIFQLSADKNVNLLTFPHKENEDALRLAIFVEVLSDPVAATTYAALKTIHQARGYDLVVVTGYSSILLTKSMFEKAGWSVSLHSTNNMLSDDPTKRFLSNGSPDVKNHYLLKPMGREVRKLFLDEQSSLRFERDGLDLSHSSNPVEDLALFSSLSTLKQVDISWCQFQGKELEAFLNAFDHPIEIFASGDEPWFFYLSQMSDIKLTRREDHKKGELAPFAPHIAKKIGVTY